MKDERKAKENLRIKALAFALMLEAKDGDIDNVIHAAKVFYEYIKTGK